MKNLGNIGVIVAARLGSTRLPGKALKPLQGMPMLVFLLRRLRSGGKAKKIILATSTQPEDTALADLAKAEGVNVYRGPVDDVTARYVGAAKAFKLDTVIRVTADCPFLNGEVVDHCLDIAAGSRFDLCTTKGRFPIGLDVEIYPSELMARLDDSEKLTGSHREHLTLYFYQNKDQYKVVEMAPRVEWIETDRIYTVDTPEDYVNAVALAERFETPFFSITDLVALEHYAH